MSLPSLAAGVGQPLVIGAEGVSAKNRRRAGVRIAFKVQCGSVPPSPVNRVRNLFAKDCWRLSLADEPEEIRPEMPFIALTFRAAMSNATDWERLTGARACPNRSWLWPSCEAQGVGPAANTCEEMALDESAEIVGLNIYDAPFIDLARGDESRLDKFPQPGCGFRIVFIVVVHSG
jgi:hypothetical protein